MTAKPSLSERSRNGTRIVSRLIPARVLPLLLFAVAVAPPLMQAQDGTDTLKPGRLERVTFRVGLNGSLSRNFHETSSSIFAAGGACGAFGNGDGQGFAAGAFFEVPVRGELISLHGGIGLAQRGGSFGEAVTGGLPILEPGTGEYGTLERTHTYTADLIYMQSEFGVRVTAPWVPIYLRGVASLGFPQNATFEQREQITSPEGVLYPETNEAIRQVAAGDLQKPELQMMAAGTIGYELPMGEQLSIAPEITWYQPFGDVTLNREWRVSSLHAGAALRWSFGPIVPEPVIAAPAPPPPAPSAPAPNLRPSAALTVRAPAELNMVRTIVTETFPLLPYLFFDSASADIASRYSPLNGRSFDEADLERNSLDVYYEVLNIVGARMAADESLQLTAVGTTDGEEESTPGARENLARARAAAVRNYLVDAWEIDPARVSIMTAERPQHPSSTLYREGFVENRRVELRASDPALLRPILHEKFQEYSFTPKSIELDLGGSDRGSIREWELDLRANGQRIIREQGSGAPPASVQFDITGPEATLLGDALAAGGDLHAEVRLEATNGLTGEATAVVPTSVETNPFEVYRLSLIVFDFDRADISEYNRRMVDDFVGKSLGPGSQLRIVGSTDRLGDPEHNRQLSQQRADAVYSLVTSRYPEAEVGEVTGIGQRLAFNNDLPEGRYYCRTVTVEVHTPLLESLQN